MKFSLFALTLAATVAAQTSNNATSSAMLTCLQNCNPSDVNCRANCVGVPNPTSTQAAQTVQCVSQCNQNDTTAFTNCRNGCISSNFMAGQPSSGSTPSSAPSAPSASTGNSSNGTNATSAAMTYEGGSAVYGVATIAVITASAMMW